MALSRFLAAQIDFVTTNSPLPIRVDNIRTGTANFGYADRFTVVLPCFLDQIRWDVVYNSDHPRWPPDIIFGIDDEGFMPLVVKGGDQGPPQSAWAILRDWNAEDPARLLRLLIELRKLYLDYQRKRVEEIDDPRLQFEISTLGGVEGLEMGLVAGVDGPEVNFAIPLPSVDLSQIVKACQIPMKLHGLSLQVKFPVERGKSSSSVPLLKLVGPSTLKDAFDFDEVKLPVWPDRMCIMEYTGVLQEMLQAQVQDACISMGLRRNFMEALLPVFGHPLEAETMFCRKISVVAASALFTFMVHFFLPIQFPKIQPSIIFQSSQHFDSSGKPVTSRVYTNYPWSPRWNTVEMVQRICDFIAEECLSFKVYCNDIVQHHQ